MWEFDFWDYVYIPFGSADGQHGCRLVGRYTFHDGQVWALGEAFGLSLNYPILDGKIYWIDICGYISVVITLLIHFASSWTQLTLVTGEYSHILCQKYVKNSTTLSLIGQKFKKIQQNVFLDQWKKS